MMRDSLRQWAGVGLAAVAGLFAFGIFSTVDTSPEPARAPPLPSPTVRADLTRPLPSTPRHDAAAPAPDPRDAQLEAAREVIRELEEEAYGTPRVWDDSIPITHRPETVIPAIEGMLADGSVQYRLIGFDCDEPPCIAIFDSTGHQPTQLLATSTWEELWGERQSIALDWVQCEDGSTRRFAAISPGVRRVSDAEFQARAARDPTPEEIEESVNSSKRWAVRIARWKPQVCE